MPVRAATRSASTGLIAAAASWGLFWGGWAALLPGLIEQVGATEAQFGLALFGIPVGALPAMVATAPLARALRAWTLPVVLVAFAVACALPGLATSPLALAASLLLVGATSGAIEVALNTTTAAHEARDGVRLFNKVHAATPLAMVLAAPAVGLARQNGVAPLPVLLVIAGLVLLSALLAVDRDGWRAAPAEPGPRRSVAPLLIAFGVLAAVVLFVENAVEQWGALHLEQGMGAGPLLGSAAPACYMAGLFAGRLLAQWRGDRVSGRALVLTGGALGAVGIGTAALAARAGLPPALALAGFAIAGVGLAPALPTLLGLAGAAVDDARRPGAIAAVTTLSYLGFLVSPPVVGVMAGAWGLTPALTAVACGGLLVAAASIVVRAPGTAS
ncbi:MFS transporter [Saccharothrix coeruleofusca]|uniref:MFS transporter n=1 Tax=Saccharothrix coeruleofusca TaxID=33919 RepID=A0A918AND2_9PSEU|nr:MFS transporter [Saccharothrix coeruleofusca]MBP2336083.1 MFS family permease [Saccharothrix coeruleofusca]GGP55527.1 MFS transporter [Saccharothrix coeruleofusca]